MMVRAKITSSIQSSGGIDGLKFEATVSVAYRLLNHAGIPGSRNY